MSEWRIAKHPVLSIPETKKISFYWNEKKLEAIEGEVISSALFANGIHVFGHHPKDNSAQGMRSEERRVGKECRSRWSPYH